MKFYRNMQVTNKYEYNISQRRLNYYYDDGKDMMLYCTILEFFWSFLRVHLKERRKN
jgi:hypothetical protein